jgi:hypothetical protein
MYESPKLNRVGQAEDVILGLTPSGNDIDTNYMIPDMEWGYDEDIADEESGLRI